MLSLFNPYVLLGLVLAVLGSFGAGYYNGEQNEHDRQQLKIAELNDAARVKEQALINVVQTQSTKLQKANQDAKAAQQKRNADIDSGTFRLRVPIKTPICPLYTTTDTPVASGDSVQATTELDRETAKALIAITEDGDAAIRKLNSCIDSYETLRSLR